MRKLALIALCFTLFALTAQARTFESRIVSIDIAENDPEVLVMAAEEGRVLRADVRDVQLVEALQAAVATGATIRFDIGARGVINGAQQVPAEKALANDVNPLRVNPAFNFTVFNSVEETQTAFNTMSRKYKDKSQCFNRAHVWSFELWKYQRVSTGKVFVFFTRPYIRKYNFEWWFHVAPYTHTMVNGVQTEMVLDRRYTSGPRDMRTWTNVFMKNDALCPEVQKYSDYRQNQAAQWCYLIKTNMYYRSPMDIELHEKNGREELDWNNAEIRTARKEAFSNWRSFNP